MQREVPPGEVTQLLLRWQSGDESALPTLIPLVYEELRTLARRHLGRESGPHTLQRTALVHEAFLRMVDQTHVDWRSRSQFFAVASQMMRRVLVDHARRKTAIRMPGAPVAGRPQTPGRNRTLRRFTRRWSASKRSTRTRDGWWSCDSSAASASTKHPW
jgi:DNA-directed RNA polymerase specialized sigma24 family protein